MSDDIRWSYWIPKVVGGAWWWDQKVEGSTNLTTLAEVLLEAHQHELRGARMRDVYDRSQRYIIIDDGAPERELSSCEPKHGFLFIVIKGEKR